MSRSQNGMGCAPIIVGLIVFWFLFILGIILVVESIQS